jgi:hypothetical protein
MKGAMLSNHVYLAQLNNTEGDDSRSVIAILADSDPEAHQIARAHDAKLLALHDGHQFYDVVNASVPQRAVRPALINRIETAIKKELPIGPVLESILEDVRHDGVLPMLGLHDDAPVSFISDDDEWCLEVGPRDWQWDKVTGEKLGCGTMLEKTLDAQQAKSQLYVNHQFTITEELQHEMYDFLHDLPEEHKKKSMRHMLEYIISEAVSETPKFELLTVEDAYEPDVDEESEPETAA